MTNTKITGAENFCVSYILGDDPHSREREAYFVGRRVACLFAQRAEENGGSATVTDGDDKVVDHWKDCTVSLVPNGTEDSIGLALGAGITGGSDA